jgi:hypothetical protein
MATKERKLTRKTFQGLEGGKAIQKESHELSVCGTGGICTVVT